MTVVGILSGKGGVGKTTVVSNLGAALTNLFNKDVLIVDGNLSTSHLGMHLGLYEDLPVTINDVLTKNMPLTYATYVHPATGIRILPAPLKSDLRLKMTRMNKAIHKIKDDYDLILLDFSPGLGREVVSLLDTVDLALIVTTPDLPAVTNALKTITLLEKKNQKIGGIILNKVNHAN